jgi:hypothetical protein
MPCINGFSVLILFPGSKPIASLALRVDIMLVPPGRHPVALDEVAGVSVFPVEFLITGNAAAYSVFVGIPAPDVL